MSPRAAAGPGQLPEATRALQGPLLICYYCCYYNDLNVNLCSFSLYIPYMYIYIYIYVGGLRGLRGGGQIQAARDHALQPPLPRPRGAGSYASLY